MNLPRSLKRFKGQLAFKEQLAKHTTFKIGGPVKIWAQPASISSLRLLLQFAADEGLPILVVAEGSNLLVADSQLEALAIHLDSLAFSRIRFQGSDIIVGAGAKLTPVLNHCLVAGKSGIEFLAGIPASVGGAIWCNAAALSGAKMRSMADIVEGLTVMTADGKLEHLKRRQIDFGYKSCSLSQCIILGARLALEKSSFKKVKGLLVKNMARRIKTQPLQFSSAGCIFKNPSGAVSTGLTAGYLIDKALLKGKRIGGAQVSTVHANFIINTGKASAQDVLELIDLIKIKVRKKFRVELEPEIKIIRDIALLPALTLPIFL